EFMSTVPRSGLPIIANFHLVPGTLTQVDPPTVGACSLSVVSIYPDKQVFNTNLCGAGYNKVKLVANEEIPFAHTPGRPGRDRFRPEEPFRRTLGSGTD